LPPEQQEPLVVGKKVSVIGGGDTAMDCVRTAMRLQVRNGLPGDVTCVYRRTEAEMPGRGEERVHAKEEGVQFFFLAAPVRLIGDNGQVKAMECIRMELGEPDASGRRRPVPIKGSEFIIETDTVVLALGYSGDPIVPQTTPGLKTKKGNLIEADEEAGGQTSRPGVFAAGDNVRGADLVVTALAAARKAAAAMDEYLKSL
jgi:glutamate synthase (NADPH/NADH) small chain